MQIGSIVETVGNFETERKNWGLPYPKTGDVLTVMAITKHPNKDVSKKGIVLLHFEEIPNLTGICDKTIQGKPNFVELLLPIQNSVNMSAYTQIESSDIPLHHLWRALQMTQAEFMLCLEYRRFTPSEQKVIKETIKEWEGKQ